MDILQNLEGHSGGRRNAGSFWALQDRVCSTFPEKRLPERRNGFLCRRNFAHQLSGYQPRSHATEITEVKPFYTAEVDVHFPMMTVGENTLFSLLWLVAPTAHSWWRPALSNGAEHQRDVIMALYGIAKPHALVRRIHVNILIGIPHTINTQVGNDFHPRCLWWRTKACHHSRGPVLSRATLQSWDNSTRGLDSANAIEFVKTLRMETENSRKRLLASQSIKLLKLHMTTSIKPSCFMKAARSSSDLRNMPNLTLSTWVLIAQIDRRTPIS